MKTNRFLPITFFSLIVRVEPLKQKLGKDTGQFLKTHFDGLFNEELAAACSMGDDFRPLEQELVQMGLQDERDYIFMDAFSYMLPLMFEPPDNTLDDPPVSWIELKVKDGLWVALAERG